MRTWPIPPVINEVKCIGCGLCEQVCNYEAIKVLEKNISGRVKLTASIDQAKCYGCGLCVSVCPTRALKFTE